MSNRLQLQPWLVMRHPNWYTREWQTKYNVSTVTDTVSSQVGDTCISDWFCCPCQSLGTVVWRRTKGWPCEYPPLCVFLVVQLKLQSLIYFLWRLNLSTLSRQQGVGCGGGCGMVGWEWGGLRHKFGVSYELNHSWSIYTMAIGKCYSLEPFDPQKSWLPRSSPSDGGCVFTK